MKMRRRIRGKGEIKDELLRRAKAAVQSGMEWMKKDKTLSRLAKEKTKDMKGLKGMAGRKFASWLESKGYGRKRRTRRRRGGAMSVMPVRRTLRGRGFFSNIWSGIKKAANWIKDNKIISRVGSVIPIPAVQKLASAAGAVGLGRRRRARRMMGGGYIPSTAMNFDQIAKPKF